MEDGESSLSVPHWKREREDILVICILLLEDIRCARTGTLGEILAPRDLLSVSNNNNTFTRLHSNLWRQTVGQTLSLSSFNIDLSKMGLLHVVFPTYGAMK